MAICIHVIESDDALATQLTDTLESFGAQVVRSTDGADGIRRAIADRPAAVLLGLMDDKGAGYALCSKLRRKLRELPVVMVVDAAEQDARRLAEHRTLSTAADAYLQRPFSVRALHDTLGSLLAEPLARPAGGLEVLIGDQAGSQFQGLFEGEADADIEAATEKWFDSIMTPDSMPPPCRPAWRTTPGRARDQPGRAGAPRRGRGPGGPAPRERQPARPGRGDGGGAGGPGRAIQPRQHPHQRPP
ncbi:MAG: response regulator [bacterium]